jgi:hypothetical protein
MDNSRLASIRKRWRELKTAIQRSLIKGGLLPPPAAIDDSGGRLTDEQRAAQETLSYHVLPRPPRNPRG